VLGKSAVGATAGALARPVTIRVMGGSAFVILAVLEVGDFGVVTKGTEGAGITAGGLLGDDNFHGACSVVFAGNVGAGVFELVLAA